MVNSTINTQYNISVTIIGHQYFLWRKTHNNQSNIYNEKKNQHNNQNNIYFEENNNTISTTIFSVKRKPIRKLKKFEKLKSKKVRKVEKAKSG